MKKMILVLVFAGGCAGGSGSTAGDGVKKNDGSCLANWRGQNQARIGNLNDEQRVGAYANLARRCHFSEEEMKLNF